MYYIVVLYINNNIFLLKVANYFKALFKMAKTAICFYEVIKYYNEKHYKILFL